MPVSRIGPRGQVVLPKAIRQALGVTPGDRVVFSLEGDRVVLTPVPARTAAELRGILRAERPVDLKEARRAYQEHLAERFLAAKADGWDGPLGKDPGALVFEDLAGVDRERARALFELDFRLGAQVGERYRMTLAVGVAVGGLAAALTRTALDLGWARAGAAGLAFGTAAGASLQALWEDRDARGRLGFELLAGGAVARRRAALAALVSTVVTGAALVSVGALAELPANLRAGLQVLALATGWAAATLGWFAARPPAGGGEHRAGVDPGRPSAEGRGP